MDLKLFVLEKEVYSVDDILSLHVHTEQGILGVFPNHANMLTTLSAGKLHVEQSKNDDKYFWITGGSMTIKSNKIDIVVNALFDPEDYDYEKVLEEISYLNSPEYSYLGGLEKENRAIRLKELEGILVFYRSLMDKNNPKLDY